MTGIFLLDWATLAVSLHNTILLLWLALTVWLNAERRTLGIGFISGALLLASSTCWGEGGPTPRLSRAAERAFMKRHGVQAKICSQHSCWRRRLQAYVGPGHGRRRAFGMPDRGHGRDTDVAESDSDMTIRDIATSPTARDPATGHPARTGPYGTPCPATDTTARDDHPRRHARRRAIRHATTILVAVPGDGRYGTRRASRTR